MAQSYVFGAKEHKPHSSDLLSSWGTRGSGTRVGLATMGVGHTSWQGRKGSREGTHWGLLDVETASVYSYL